MAPKLGGAAAGYEHMDGVCDAGWCDHKVGETGVVMLLSLFWPGESLG